MKTWIKYGLWGIGISIILSIVAFIYNLLIGMPITIIMDWLGLKIYAETSAGFWIGGFLNPAIMWFLIGAIIGLIVRKVRGENDK